jgi:ribonuclease D
VTAGSERPRGGLPDARAPEGTERPRGGLPDARAPEGTERPRGGLPDARAPEGTEAGGIIPLLEPRDGMPPVVATDAALAEVTGRLARGEGPVAVDAERASGYRYGQRAYLVQLRRSGAGTVLIDPISCPDLSGVDAALQDAEAVLHAASQDLPCLAEIGFRPRRLFDTELAGRLLGYPRVALGTLVEEVLGFHLEKGHSAADWSARPLREELLRYAALDVEVLIELRDALADELAAQGKTEWARQEFAAVLAARPAPARPDPWRRTSGIHRVQSRRGLAVVRELWTARDRIAQRADLSPHRVLLDTAIVEAARSYPANHAQLTRISGFASRQARRYERDWLAAVARARASADHELPETTGGTIPNGPPPAHRWAERDPAAAARLAAARGAITALAEENRVPAENLLSPDALRRLSWDPPRPRSGPSGEPSGEQSDEQAVAQALADYGARPWQIELTAGPLAQALDQAKTHLLDAADADAGDT